MKKLYILMVLAGVFTCQLFAQSPDAVAAINSRLIGTASDQWVSNAWNDYDTTTLSYTGTRGGEYVNFQIVADYDVQQRWQYSSGALNNNSLNEKTYNANNQLTQATYKTWSAGAWNNFQRETYTYNSQGLQTLELNEGGTGSGPSDWEPSVRFSSTYDANGNKITYQRDDWNGSSWQGYQKSTFTYDGSNRILTSIVQTFSGGSWQNDSKSTYTYNANGLTATYNYETWSAGAWQPYQRTNYTYNAQNNVTLRVIERYLAGNWENYDKLTNTYNGQGYLTESVIEEGNGANWEKFSRTTHVRDSQGNSTEETRYSWQGSWVESNRITRTFDAAGNMLISVTAFHTAGTWNDGYANTYTYNSFNQLTSAVNEEDFGSGLENTFRYFYYYENYEDGTSGLNGIPVLESSIMPNPFTVNVAINLTATQAGEHTFEVYNMAGQRVHSEMRYWPVGAQTIVFNGHDLPKGVYFYRINGTGGVATGKLVKQ